MSVLIYTIFYESSKNLKYCLLADNIIDSFHGPCLVNSHLIQSEEQAKCQSVLLFSLVCSRWFIVCWKSRLFRITHGFYWNVQLDPVHTQHKLELESYIIQHFVLYYQILASFENSITVFSIIKKFLLINVLLNLVTQ